MLGRDAASDTGCSVRAADAECAEHFAAIRARWDHVFTAPLASRPLTILEQLLCDHSTFIVPHLDAVAARPADHAFAVVTPHARHAGLHYHL